jgi:hypothetical protein
MTRTEETRKELEGPPTREQIMEMFAEAIADLEPGVQVTAVVVGHEETPEGEAMAVRLWNIGDGRNAARAFGYLGTQLVEAGHSLPELLAEIAAADLAVLDGKLTKAGKIQPMIASALMGAAIAGTVANGEVPGEADLTAETLN